VERKKRERVGAFMPLRESERKKKNERERDYASHF